MVDRSGFSLLELLVVVSLVGIMAAMALPRLGGLGMSDPLAGAAVRIVELINGVRSRAVQSGQAQFLLVDSGNGRLWCEEDSPKKQGRLPSVKVVELPERVRLRTVVVGGEAVSGGGPAKLWVSRQGVLRPLVLDLTDQSGRVLRLTVHPLFPKVEMTSLAADGAPGKAGLPPADHRRS